MTRLSATYIISFSILYLAILDLWLTKYGLKELYDSVSLKAFTFFFHSRQFHCTMSSDEFESGSDVEDVHGLVINEHFAKALEYKNEREELAKC